MTPEEKAAQDALEAAAAEEADAIAQLEGGFEGKITPEEGKETPAEGETAPNETPDGTETAEGTDSPGETPKEEEPKFAQITEVQFQELLAKANSVDDIKSAVEKLRGDAFGKLGGLERTLKGIQETTPVGQPIEVSDDDLKELVEEYPELTPRLAKSLTRIFGKLKGTGASSGQSEEDVQKLIEARASEIATGIAAQEGQKVLTMVLSNQLETLHRGWKDLVGPKDSNTEFRMWLHTQSDEKKVLGSYDPNEIADAITRFKEHKKKTEVKPSKPARPTDARSQRLAEAVPVRGGGGKPPMPRQKSAQEEFEEGFNERAAR